ncbi:MFS transporter [Streptacidiphilus monticola]
MRGLPADPPRLSGVAPVAGPARPPGPGRRGRPQTPGRQGDGRSTPGRRAGLRRRAADRGQRPRALLPAYRTRTLFCGLFFLCQVGPLFAMLTFGPQILGSFGLPGGTVMDTLGTGLISMVFLLGCYPALRAIDGVGRRPTIVWSFALMIVPLALLGVWPSAPAAVALVALCAYAFLCGGPNVLDWTYPNELFPTHIRATAVGFATSVSRVGAAIGTYLLPCPSPTSAPARPC